MIKSSKIGMVKKLLVDIPDDLHKKLSIIAASREVSMKDIVIKALETELDDDRDKKNLEKLWGKK